MGRNSRFTPDSFVDAAVALVAEGGVGAATLAAIARKAGGPTGSVYHRFPSRAAILATAWIAIHRDFSARMRRGLDESSGLLAALAIPEWARQEPRRARFLLLNPPGALIGAAPQGALEGEIEAEEKKLEEAFMAYVQAAVGIGQMPDAESIARARFLVFDAPIALTTPYLVSDEKVPGFVDAVIREMHGGVAVVRSRPNAR